MTFALRWAVVGLLLAAACSINHRSDEFTCEKPSDCSTGRTCISGFCVAPQSDAGVRGDATQSDCPTPCTTCSNDARSCTIDCARNPDTCNDLVVCPAGWSCNILCSTSTACSRGIDCTTGRSCTITCSGRESCRDVVCGPGRCNLDCSGSESCSDVSCELSCACDVACRSGSLCSGLTCKSPACTVGRLGCTSQLTGCNTCL